MPPSTFFNFLQLPIALRVCFTFTSKLFPDNVLPGLLKKVTVQFSG